MIGEGQHSDDDGGEGKVPATLLVKLALHFYAPFLGTLWKVREDLWREICENYVSDRTWHPALSLLPPRSQPEEHSVTFAASMPTLGVIPVLHGTSGKSGPVVIREVTNEPPAGRSTSFGHIFAPLPLAEFVKPSLDFDRDKLEGAWHEVRRVSVNWHKPHLDDDEMEHLKQWLPEYLKES